MKIPMELFDTLLAAMLPERCLLCTERIQQPFCIDCMQLLPWIAIGCEICGAQLSEVGVCGRCQAQPPYYDNVIIPFQYRSPIAEQIQRLKYNRKLRYASPLAAMILQRVWKSPQPPPQVLIPMPLHRHRLRQRGFNQALEIAKPIGNQLGIEVNYSLLARIKNTASQTGLNVKQRHKNVRGAFQVMRPITMKHVALIDDVVTSGNTVNTAARALKRAGVKTVSVWAVART